MDKKTHIIYLKAQIFIFFSDASPLWNQITNKNTNDSSMAKYNNVTSKEDRQKNKLDKHCSKFTTKTLIYSQYL